LLSSPLAIDAENNVVANEEQNFEFRFLTDKWVETNQTRKVETQPGKPPKVEPMFWMDVGKVMFWNDYPEFDQIFDQLYDECRNPAQKEAFSQQKRFIKRGLDILHTRIHRDELINFLKSPRMTSKIFLKFLCQVNSGGAHLSKPDLLFSTIVARAMARANRRLAQENQC
jgi:hypothetical protein